MEILAAMPVPPGATLVRALHHDETAVPEIPVALDLLGQRLAAQFHHHYHPRLLKKSRSTRPVKAFGRPQREEELQDLYAIDPSYAATLTQGPPGHWLIIDDILTSGATIRAIIGAIHRSYPGATLSIFTLTRAGTVAPSHSPTSIKGQHYQLEQGMDWILSEPSQPFYSLLQLKAMIRADTF
jgi:hypothetical protein